MGATARLKKWAADQGFSVDKGVAYGRRGGYWLTVTDAGATIWLHVAFCPPTKTDETGTTQPDLTCLSLLADAAAQQQYGIGQVRHTPRSVSVQLNHRPGADLFACAMSLADRLTADLRAAGAGGESTCGYCGGQMGTEPGSIKLIAGVAQPIHDGCAGQLQGALATEQMQQAQIQKHYGRGFLGSLLGGIVGVIPWVLAYSFGWFVGWLGFLIGFAAKKGYELLGGKPGKGKVWIVALTVIFCVVLAVFVGDFFQLAQLVRAGEGEWAGTAMGELPGIMLANLLANSTYQLEVVKNLLLSLVFAGLGVYSLIAELREEHASHQTTVINLK